MPVTINLRIAQPLPAALFAGTAVLAVVLFGCAICLLRRWHSRVLTAAGGSADSGSGDAGSRAGSDGGGENDLEGKSMPVGCWAVNLVNCSAAAVAACPPCLHISDRKPRPPFSCLLPLGLAQPAQKATAHGLR